MKNLLPVLFLLTCGAASLWADEATTLQVAPSDQVVYPDASQVLNKTEPKAAKAASTAPAKVISTKPLAAAVPVPVATKAVPLPPEPVKPGQGWFVRWTVTGDEAAARAWADTLGRPTTVQPGASGEWEVFEGPLTPATLKSALEGQAGKAVLVRR
jgi:hypothetical protein